VEVDRVDREVVASGCGERCNPATDDLCPISGFRPTPCSTATDGTGLFSFVDVPARTFTIVATDPINNVKGSFGGPLNPGEQRIIRIVLEPSAVLSGRATLNGAPATGIVAELKIPSAVPGQLRSLFAVSRADGAFRFAAVPITSYALVLEDPAGSGVASASARPGDASKAASTVTRNSAWTGCLMRCLPRTVKREGGGSAGPLRGGGEHGFLSRITRN